MVEAEGAACRDFLHEEVAVVGRMAADALALASPEFHYLSAALGAAIGYMGP